MYLQQQQQQDVCTASSVKLITAPPCLHKVHMHSPAVAFAARNGCHLASFDVRSAAVDCAALPFGPLERRPKAPKRLKVLRTGPSHPFWHAPVAHRPLCVCSTMSKARRQTHAAQLHPDCLQHLQLQALMQTQMLNLPCAVELQHGLVFGGLHTRLVYCRHLLLENRVCAS